MHLLYKNQLHIINLMHYASKTYRYKMLQSYVRNDIKKLIHFYYKINNVRFKKLYLIKCKT